eukprot:CAMPEP_0196764098 /NCGR_PEP_ID=MMETSP1095-20130614/5350_1 /TAXON_ID=96789 ORGANISM="Chromulina nebulosa, Strain UTEXLB2642" /NCGR_SAMPLE_ID=MMETSP1095 /ASSEMBLY_ACC=CAM_ASM_000446 /LENGTH=707 /DNA_ID=CAMNT_0042118727 /DNA_START=171 /DNA_END=2294 /DNA_ORIENTATION=-
MLVRKLELFTYLSCQKDELIVLIRCKEEVLGEFADAINFEMLLNPEAARTALAAGGKTWEGRTINDKPDVTTIKPYDFVYGKYEQSYSELPSASNGYKYSGYYQVSKYHNTPFNQQVRLKLIVALLRTSKNKGGCNLLISKLIKEKKIKAFFPLHDPQFNKDLYEEALSYTNMPWNQPIEDIRYYFGEKVALYNYFLGHYTGYLIVPSVIGAIFQLVVWATLDFSNPVVPFFALVITIWSIVLLEGWKRKESFIALEWGMSNFEQTEIDRPEFTSDDVIDSFIDGSKNYIYYPSSKKAARLSYSFTLIGSYIMLVIGVVASIYYMRFSLQATIGSSASTLASIVNAVQITVFNVAYQYIVVLLTDLENHRTDTLYQDSLIVKVFIFQFINSYASFFFLAFIAQNLPASPGTDPTFLGQCGYINCMQPLSINLGIIFGSRLFVTNILDLLIPYLKMKYNEYSETKDKNESTLEALKKDSSKHLSPAELDYIKLPYDMNDNILNYADTAVQYGFMVLFASALPIACFISMINSYIKIRVNAYKQAMFYQRPVPEGAQDIGTWQTIFTILSVASVITNAGLICFTMDVLSGGSNNSNSQDPNYSYVGKLWVFLGFQWVMLSIQFILSAAIPDIPEQVDIQLQRANFIVSKIINQDSDEDFIDPQLAQSAEKVNANKRSSLITTAIDIPYHDTFPMNRTNNQWPALLVDSL